MAKCGHDKRFAVAEGIGYWEVRGCLACKFIELTKECERLQRALSRIDHLVTDVEHHNLRIKAYLAQDWQDNDSPQAEETLGTKKAA